MWRNGFQNIFLQHLFFLWRESLIEYQTSNTTFYTNDPQAVDGSVVEAL